MEQIVILILFVVASIVSSILQNKKKREEEAQSQPRNPQRPGERPTGPARPFQRWPRNATEWQEELRRLIEEQTGVPRSDRPISPPPAAPSTPPIIVTSRKAAPAPAPFEVETAEGEMVLPTRLRESGKAYLRAANLHERVEERMRAVDEKTGTHPPAVVHARLRPAGMMWTRNRQRVREAFVASLIFSPPKAFERPDPGSFI